MSIRRACALALPVIAAATALAVSATPATATVTMAGGVAAGAKTPQVTLTPLGTYRTGAFASGASEIVAHDPIRQRVFVVNAQAGTVDVLDISDPTAPRKVGSLATPGANSVAVRQHVIAVAEQAAVKTDPGTVTFFDARTLAPTGQVTVGALPDMVTIADNGNYALVANEGEPDSYCADGVDPEGSVSIIDLRRGAARATVRTADFRKLNSRKAELVAAGVRIFGPNASVAQDLEPEYITLSTNGRTAYVSLQEANAIATVDVASATVTDVRALGLKDHSIAGNGLDASDKDKAVNITTWPIKGMFMPDSVASYQVKGKDHVVTANEGDARDYACFAEERRIKDVTLDPAVFPNAKDLQKDGALGRLNTTTTSPSGAAGLTEIHTFGARSISVVDMSTGSMTWDSGDSLEKLVARVEPAFFNSDHESASFDNRSDNKGPEPEGLALGKIGGSTFAFVGLERQSGIAVFDVTDPRAGRLAGYGSNRVFAGDPKAGTAGDLGPEGVHFIAAGDSPNGKPLLAVGNEISGTTTLWQVAVTR